MPLLNDLNAIAQGGQLGVDNYASTLQKAITPYTYPILHKLPIIGQYARNPNSVQSDYEQNIRDTANNPDVKAHPLLSMAGQLAGNAAMTAPLIAAMGPEMAMSAKGGTLLGGVSGALYNQPGQQNITNIPNALIGAGLGAIIAPISNQLNSVINGTTTKALNALPDNVQSYLPETLKSSLSSNAEKNGYINLTNSIQNPNLEPQNKGVGLISDLVNSISFLKPSLKGAGLLGSAGAAIGGLINGEEGAYQGGKIGSEIGAGIGLGVNAIKATPEAIGNILSYLPIKSTLSIINDAGNQILDNSNLGTFLATKLNNQLTNAGVNMYLHASGNIHLKSQSEVDPIHKPAPTLEYDDPNLGSLPGKQQTTPQSQPNTIPFDDPNLGSRPISQPSGPVSTNGIRG